MVKQSALQSDLFDFKYIEDQVAAIKQSIDESEESEAKRELTDILEEQLSLLQEIHQLLTEMSQQGKRKRSWF